MAEDVGNLGRIVTVFGGSGFVGRHVVRALAKDGWRIRVASRRPDLAFHLQPLGRVGQIHAVQTNVRVPGSIAAALHGAQAAVNLVAVLNESGRQSFNAVHIFGSRAVARAVRDAGIGQFTHVSALGADAQSPSAYARSKAEGEAAVLEAVPAATILRPSVIFGPEDSFFNRFASLARMAPVLPLFGGGDTAFQPVFVGDVAQVVARALNGGTVPGTVYELGGPDIRTMREIMAYVCRVTGRKRALLPVPATLAHPFARMSELASGLSLGLMPEAFLLTRDQLTLLQADNVVSAAAQAQGRTLPGLGIQPETIESIVPTYLARFRSTGEFARQDA